MIYEKLVGTSISYKIKAILYILQSNTIITLKNVTYGKYKI